MKNPEMIGILLFIISFYSSTALLFLPICAVHYPPH
jgi:hypothetical protein